MASTASDSKEAEEKKTEAKQTKIIFQLGTNNWQWDDEPAPGSGILHEVHHNAYNAIDGVFSYSIYPSRFHKTADIGNNDNDLVRIYSLTANIPVCESSGPVSKRRWHAMSQQEVDEYRQTLETMVYDHLSAIEKQHGEHSLYFCVAHHTFMNCVILRNVMARREAEKKHIPPLMVFVHGTGLKMYQNELKAQQQAAEQDDSKRDVQLIEEFPMKFYTWIKDELQLFSNAQKPGFINYCLSNSSKIIDEFVSLFPDFDRKRCLINYPGYNQKLFRYVADLTLAAVLKELALKPIELNAQNDGVVRSEQVIGSELQYDGLVVFVGRLADWKRMDLVMDAAEIYDAEFVKAGKKVLTLCIGGGIEQDQMRYLQKFRDLKNKHIFYVGPQNQPALCQLWNVAEVGVYPSKNEPFGMVFVETMACGTPVIGARSGGPMEFVDEKVGALVDENEDRQVMVQDLAKYVIQFVNNGEKAKKRKECLKRAAQFGSVGMQQKLLRDLEPLLMAK
eukprot:CAMPEP_0197054782 /NCGR_PEP_ID=MMETSP1384-20130603/49797_1 /TAXON_ID=29189 /ORGANISM="Ammonia sp." /LENGTH=504 /DNA_ID=CAMNT_0042488091 /DNA_START=22 /DNA_END=1536 /DNA_ORIENTATION=-